MTINDQEIEDQLRALRVAAPDRVTDGILLGTGLADGYRTFDSPVGAVIVTFNPRGVSSLDLAGAEAIVRFEERFDRGLRPAEPPRGWASRIQQAIERGRPGTLPVDLRSVTTFQGQVLQLTARIPRGQVRPYGWLARELGRPRASRAIGTALATNPMPLIIPCHRVVRADGRIGNYSLGGPDIKNRLLDIEGADPALLEDLARRHVRYRGSDTTHIYCHPTCSNARRITLRHRVDFPSAEAARRAGFRPCQVCRPA